MLSHNLDGAPQLPRSRAGNRVIERQDKIGLSRQVQTMLDDRPGLQVVRQRHHAEIMPQRCTRLGSGRQRSRDPGQDLQIDTVPGRVVGPVQRFEHRSGHGEHAWVAG
ncbi:hypothetical protein D3C76_1552450 [compost metagenome]